jgi:hypothetical protein
MEDGLARAGADVDRDAVVLETGPFRRLRDELEHALGFFRRKLADLLEARDVALGEDEQVDVGLRIDVADGDEAVLRVDVLPFAIERAEEAVLRQRGSPPP